MPIVKIKNKVLIKEAVRLDKANLSEVRELMGSEAFLKVDLGGFAIGDWIIKGVTGEIYCCPNEVFEKSYDIVETT